MSPAAEVVPAPPASWPSAMAARLHRYLRSFRPDEDFAGWLYRLVVNACHDLRKRRGGHLSYEA